MGIKSFLNEVCRYNDFDSNGQLFFLGGIITAFAGAGGFVVSSLGSNFALDGVEDKKAKAAQVEYYNGKIKGFAEAEKSIVKLSDFIDQADLEAKLSDNQSETKRKVERARTLLAEEKKALGSNVYRLSQEMVVDRNIPENGYDDFVSKMAHAVVTYRLPDFIYNDNGLPVPYDSQLRECQLKIGGAEGVIPRGKAQDIANCTGDRIGSIHKYGIMAGAGLCFTWFGMLGPAFAARSRRKEVAKKKAEEESPNRTTSLKIIMKK